MQANMKILTVNITTELSQLLLSSFSENQHTITMVDNLYSNTTTKMLDEYQILLVQTDNDTYTPIQLKEFCQSNPFVEVIGITSSHNTNKHLFIKAGLFEVITEDCTHDELMSVLLKSFNSYKNKVEISHLKQYVAMNFGFDNLIGESKQILKLKEKIRKVSPTDISVLISGTSGSGKFLTAKIMHHHSERRKQPFIVLDSSSTPETMFDTILFGNENSQSSSLLAKADKGTLYIKDLHLLPMSTQKKLIKFINTHSIQTTETTTRKLSVRFLSSTNCNINSMINSGTFEKELFHYLSEISITIPTLNERLEDIESLSEYFVRKISHESSNSISSISRTALELLYTHHWVENVRELETTIKRATTLCRSSQIDEHDILFIESGNAKSTSNRFTVDMSSDQGNGILDEGQRSLIVKTLNDNNWNYTQTAHELGIGRTTLWRKVKKYNLKKESAELV